ncbi:MAG: lysine--tRNA ligase [Immundisolibacteraceae bacterium]|nr:lysine--tRNA ligase [Immundisolibacteraceae bacterium]
MTDATSPDSKPAPADTPPAVDENEQIAQRRSKLAALREQGNAFPNQFRRDHLMGDLASQYADTDREALEANPVTVKVAGRIMTRRIMGKASFANIQDMGGAMQVYVQRDSLPEGFYNTQFKKWDLGDLVGVEGTLFRTKTDELTIRVSSIELLVKALRPLPEKFHGLQDQEVKYRQRYLDLIVSEQSRQTFKIRSQVVAEIRRFLSEDGFIEVETPMMHAIPGGAIARPFETHHNALDMQLFLRIAPELYLKRLVVGGMERVFEVNRSFRNEGLSTRHNPEFTMLEFYEAYADYHDLMAKTETLLSGMVKRITGNESLTYQDEEINFSAPFKRYTVEEAVLEYNPGTTVEQLRDPQLLAELAEQVGAKVQPGDGPGKVLLEIYEATAEHQLRQPTFITAFPTEVSPLARRNDDNPAVTDRFELIIGGREIANGFSELNDAEDQAERFRAQVERKDSGDQEAMYYDSDYIRALEHGLPPTAGEGIGIDRLVMLLTDSASIRDVILFPHMRPES